MMFDGLARLWDELDNYTDLQGNGFFGILSPYESEEYMNREAEMIESKFTFSWKLFCLK